MFQTFGLSHLQISVRDLEKSVRFYKELFGMNEIRRFEKCVMLQTPSTNEIFTINTANTPDTAGKMGGIAHFGFRLRRPANNTEIFEKAKQLGGASVEDGGSIEKGRMYAFVLDPDGYEVEIFWEE